MSRKSLDETITFLKQRIKEHLEEIFDENNRWEDKEDDYIRMREDLLILEKLLGKAVKLKFNL